MSHPQQMNFFRDIKNHVPSYFANCKVLEVGSLNINGSIREFFTDCDYLGIDVGPGPGVDLVCEGQNLDHPDNTYDTVCSTECFEHNPYWLQTFQNMYRMAKPNGLVLMTCATTGRPEHGTSRTSPADSPLTVGKGWDYYRNLTPEDLTTNFKLDTMFSEYQILLSNEHPDMYFCGIKRDPNIGVKNES